MIGAAIRIDFDQAVETLSVISGKPPGNQNLPVWLDKNMPSPAIKSRSNIETGVAAPVRIYAHNAHGRLPVVVAKISGQDDFSIGLDNAPKHKRINIAVDSAGNDFGATGAGVE